jgi:hypothetical protein
MGVFGMALTSVELLHSKTLAGADSTPKLQTQIGLFGYQHHPQLLVPPIRYNFLFLPCMASSLASFVLVGLSPPAADSAAHAV